MTTPIKRDAQSRAARTFAQGLGIDAAIAIAAVLLVWLPDADLTGREAWTVLGITVAKTLIQTVAAYVMRLKVAPAGEPIDYHLED